MSPAPESPDDSKKKKEAAVVDRLLRQLKYADPTLKGDEPAKPPARPPAISAPAATRRAPTAKHAWLWTGLTAVLAIAVTQWPYAHACGWGLLGFSGVLVLWVGVAGWAAITAWRARSALAHVVALVLLGVALAAVAAAVLPRVGYARVPATWRCVAAPAAPRAAPPAAPQTAPPTVPPAAPSGPAASSSSGASM